MQRVEPRELLAAAGAALAPALWWVAVGAGVCPDPRDLAGGLALFGALPAGAPLSTVPAIFVLGLWAAGYGGWRWARTWGLSSQAATTILLAAQLGPWALLPLVEADLPGLPGSEASAAVGTTVPMYRAAGGAWFPLPPSESERWREAAAWTEGRWLHPLSEAVTGSSSAALPRQALPIAVAQATVPAPPAAPPWGPALSAGAPVLAVLFFGLVAALARRQPRWLAALALLAAAGGAAAARPRPAAVRGVRTLALAEACRGALLFPAPEAPWHAGRVPAAQARAAGCRPPREADAAALVLLARWSEAGIDTRAASLALAHDGDEPAAAFAASGAVVVDIAALPGWGAARLRREASEAGVSLVEEGSFLRLGD